MTCSQCGVLNRAVMMRNSAAKRKALVEPDYASGNFFHAGRDDDYVIRVCDRLMRLFKLVISKQSKLIWS